MHRSKYVPEAVVCSIITKLQCLRNTQWERSPVNYWDKPVCIRVKICVSPNLLVLEIALVHFCPDVSAFGDCHCFPVKVKVMSTACLLTWPESLTKVTKRWHKIPQYGEGPGVIQLGSVQIQIYIQGKCWAMTLLLLWHMNNNNKNPTWRKITST